MRRQQYSIEDEDDVTGWVAEEEAPLRPRLRSLSQLAPACRRAALGWQLPGRAVHPLWAAAPLPFGRTWHPLENVSDSDASTRVVSSSSPPSASSLLGRTAQEGP